MSNNKETEKDKHFVFEVMMEIRNNKQHKRELLKVFKEKKCIYHD